MTRKSYLNYLTIVILAILFSLNANIFDEKSIIKQLSLEPDKSNFYNQLLEESIDDDLSKGRVFIPYLTNPIWEPYYKIYHKNKQIIEGKTGNSIFLYPGDYRILFGSAQSSLDQYQQSITVEAEKTYFIEPQWGAVTIDIIDENREKIRTGYEIYNAKNAISLGTKYSKEDNDYDQSKSTWILLPGKYKFLKLGEPFNSLQNFFTFDLQKGEVKRLTIVLNSATYDIIGAGEIKTDQEMISKKSFWKNYLYLKGSFALNSNNQVNENDPETDFNFKGKIENRIKYDNYPYYLNFKQNINTSWIKSDENEKIRVTTDNLKLENTGIYYLTKLFGFYAEFNAQTKFFDNYYYFDDNKNIALVKNNNETILKEGVNKIKLSNSFHPLDFSEELGINFTLIKNQNANLYLRSGLGLFQKLHSETYTKSNSYLELNSIKYEKYLENKNENSTGYIFSLSADFQLMKDLSYNGEADFIYSLTKKEDYDFFMYNSFSYKIFKYLSIEYNLNLNYTSQNAYLVYDNQLSLEFIYYFER